jgi:hypothetical protein
MSKRDAHAPEDPDDDDTNGMDVEEGVQDDALQTIIQDIDTSNPFPKDLHTMSEEEILNIHDNIRIQINRRKRDDIMARLTRCIVNSGEIIGHYTGMRMPESWARRIQDDVILKEALSSLVLGKGFKPHPAITFGLTITDHLTHTIAVNIGPRDQDEKKDE